jgi:hypothetical protein
MPSRSRSRDAPFEPINEGTTSVGVPPTLSLEQPDERMAWLSKDTHRLPSSPANEPRLSVLYVKFDSGSCAQLRTKSTDPISET